MKSAETIAPIKQILSRQLAGAVQTTIPVSQELEQVKAYLSLEQARFPNRYQVTFDVEEAVASESAVCDSGVSGKYHQACIWQPEGEQSSPGSGQSKTTQITCGCDNGQGIPEERRLLLGKTTVTSEKAPARHWKTCPAEWRTLWIRRLF